MLENKHYKIIIAYDGTDYDGWQVQPNQRSVANVIENKFYKAFRKKITLVGASRTDAGVHAHHQVATFSTDLALNPSLILKVWQQQLPLSITIHSIQSLDRLVNPRYNAVQKEYVYIIFTRRPLPWQHRYGYYYPHALDKDLLEQSLSIFVGTHDFRSFCTGYEKLNTVRTVDSIVVEYDADAGTYEIQFKGKGFLRYMLRRIIGGALMVAASQRTLADLVTILEQKNPHQRLITAPAQGLILKNIIYHEHVNKVLRNFSLYE